MGLKTGFKILIFTVFHLTISGCSINMYMMKELPNHHEYYNLSIADTITIRHGLVFDKKRWIDEEHIDFISIQIRKDNYIKDQKLFVGDTSFTINYNWFSIWGGLLSDNDDSTSISGFIIIKSIDSNSIELKENIFVTDYNHALFPTKKRMHFI
jgi:hypothetical protein